jgi:hypothetical protein
MEERKKNEKYEGRKGGSNIGKKKMRKDESKKNVSEVNTKERKIERNEGKKQGRMEVKLGK